MGGDSATQAAGSAARTNMDLEAQMYGLAKPALEAGTNYLSGVYKQGGFDQSNKYNAMQSMLSDQPIGGSIFQGNLGQAAGNRAAGYAGIGAQKLAAGVDEMNKLRSMLAQKGLRTTNLAQKAGAQSIAAIPQMQQGNQTLSAILGVGGAAAGVYGGIQGANAQSDVAKQLQAQQFFGNPNIGSDRAYLQWPSGGTTSVPSWGGKG